VSWATEGGVCKRCGAPAGAASARPKPSAPPRRVAAETGGHARPCLHCGRNVPLNKWEDWNGFLVECPHCGGMHGKHWKIGRVMTASFVFNAVSFLFTMRPAYGVLWLAAFAAAAVAGNFYLESLPDTLQVALASAFILGPMLVNAVVLVNHERGLDNSAPPEMTLEA
jgi:hypothetical protein